MCRLRYCRLFYLVSTVTAVVQVRRPCPGVVPCISSWALSASCAVHSCRPLSSLSAGSQSHRGQSWGMYCLLLFILCRSCLTDRKTWLPSSSLRGRYANVSSRPTAVHARLRVCIDDIYISSKQCNRLNCLHLNTSKTGMLWCATVRRQHQLPRAL